MMRPWTFTRKGARDMSPAADTMHMWPRDRHTHGWTGARGGTVGILMEGRGLFIFFFSKIVRLEPGLASLSGSR